MTKMQFNSRWLVPNCQSSGHNTVTVVSCHGYSAHFRLIVGSIWRGRGRGC